MKAEKVPYSGTLVLACIDCSDPGVLHKALAFGGKPYTATDFIENRFEQGESIRFTLRDEVPSFGSRRAAIPVRNQLTNLLDMCPGQRVMLDFADVPVISSSFSDEVL